MALQRVKIGDMRYTVTLQRKTVTENEYGETVETWTDIATTKAARWEIRGQERWAAQQVVASIEAKYIIRWRSDIGPLDRMVEGGKTYDILAVAPREYRKWLELTVSARGE
jgi:SPP1 family predicted phage head-tail adaptor